MLTALQPQSNLPITNTQLVKKAQLTYVSDQIPGITRVKRGKGFSYLDEKLRAVQDNQTINRIKALRIPPAWKEVWICPTDYGHIQATGRDEKGRKVYIYHQKWRELTQQQKFNNMKFFASVLPDIRAQVQADIHEKRLTKRRVLGTVVWLLEHTFIRIGNKEYAKTNDHYGLTTLTEDHVEVWGADITFSFTGKSGKDHEVTIKHPRIASTIKKLVDIPGYELFQYLDSGTRKMLDSSDVNEYLKEIAGDNVTAKEFRTWGGTVLSATTLRHLGDFDTKKQAKKNITQAVKIVAHHLGNTPTVSRNYYIHPIIPQSYTEKILLPHFENAKEIESSSFGISPEEYSVKTLLDLTLPR